MKVYKNFLISLLIVTLYVLSPLLGFSLLKGVEKKFAQLFGDGNAEA